jgi:GT2 family glycosyltransferase
MKEMTVAIAVEAGGPDPPWDGSRLLAALQEGGAVTLREEPSSEEKAPADRPPEHVEGAALPRPARAKVPDERDWLLESDCLVVPSLGSRQVPLVVAALAWGIPVITFDFSEARAALGMGGRFISPEEGVAGLVEAIRRLRSDPVERESLVRRGRAEARRARHGEHRPPVPDSSLPPERPPLLAPPPWPVRISPPPSPGYRRLSVVIACYGKRALTAACLRSLLPDTPEAEILLVDNASPDDTRAWAERQPVRLIPFAANRGVAPAWNAGLHAATGDLLCVLNNDTVIHPGGMRRLAAEAWRVGIAAHQGGVLNPELACVRLTGEAGEADYPDGCALLFRRDVWERVGAFDEGMVLGYCEDSDWGLRARALGYGWALVPDALTHLGHQTARGIAAVPEHHRRNQERLRLKWAGKGVGERIKVRRWGMLGDALMLTPALRGLRREKPLARIHFQCAPEIAAFLQGIESVDAVDPDEFSGYTAVYDLDYATWDLEMAGHWRHPTYAFADALNVAIRPEHYDVPDTGELDGWAAEQLPEGPCYVACGLRSEKRDKANWGEAGWRGLFAAAPELTFVLLDREHRPPLEPRGEQHHGPSAYEAPNVVDLTGGASSLRHLLALLRRCAAPPLRGWGLRRYRPLPPGERGGVAAGGLDGGRAGLGQATVGRVPADYPGGGALLSLPRSLPLPAE